MHAGYVFVAGTDIIPGHQRQDLLSPSLILSACVITLNLGLSSHPKEPDSEESRYPLTTGWTGQKSGKVSQ